MNAFCTSPPRRLVPALLLAACAGAMPASGEIIITNYQMMHRHIVESGDGWDVGLNTGREHLTYGERWTPPPGQQDPHWTYTQTRAQDRISQDPVTGAISGALMTSAYWNTTEPVGYERYLVAGAYLQLTVTITTPGEYGVLWLVSGPGWPNSQAFLPWYGLPEVAWIVDPSTMYLDIVPPAAPLTTGHMSAYLEPGVYTLGFANVLWPVPILPGPGERHVDQVVWFEFGAPAPGSAVLGAIALGALAKGRRR